MKIFKWISDNILFVFTLFLLAFIPLYPKLPLLGIQHTWVYVRLDDVCVALAVFIYVIQLIRRKATIKTPLTIPIIIFWGVGLISTLSAIVFLFPHMANVFPSVAMLNFLRRIEYISLFFVAYSSVKDKRQIPYIIATLVVTLLAVVGYGVGQKWFGFPAFLTMNEEFAKGIPLKLSSLARIPSTFGGHYDLAAYLVLIIPIIGSMIFGFKNIFAKLLLLLTGVAGLVLLLMTASRVSFMVYILAVSFMLILQKRKRYIIPVIIVSIFLLSFFQGMSQRFTSTISQADVVVDARTGKPIGILNNNEAIGNNTKKQKPLVIEDKQSTGENLPQGSGYINLPSDTTSIASNKVIYKRTKLTAGTQSAEITSMEGDFVVKKVLAYDVSFTTRFQGEWPRAIEAFKRNIFLGSGYSSIGLATDGDYLRMLGESGLLGFGAFILAFLVMGIYIENLFKEIDSKPVRGLIIGVSAGLFGLGLNAILIDVFEASKVAYVLWMMVGLSFGFLKLYQKKKIDVVKELRKVLTSSPAIIIYLLVASFGVYSIMISNYFVGDDFTWLKWAADCKKIIYGNGLTRCEPVKNTILGYFTNSDGFFYRPGTKLYFLLMYTVFWLNNSLYHIFSILVHFTAAASIFLISKRILKSKFFSFVTALFFIVLSVQSESVFWVAATGHIISAAAILLSLLLYINWKENKNWIFLSLSFVTAAIAFLFYELGIVIPILILVYDLIMDKKISLKDFVRRWYYFGYFSLIPIYLGVRYISKSHWFNGDYSYNISNLPYNVFGNFVGYLGISLFGVNSMKYYELIRTVAKENKIYATLGLVLALTVFYIVYRFLLKKLWSKNDAKIILLSFSIFFVGLIPFLGLGNISLRYVYLASFGIVLFIVFLIQKIYSGLRVFNRFLAMGFVAIILFVFISFNFNELNRINNDWKKAGNISNELLTNLNATFTKDNPVPQDPVFYFVNTPIRLGEAWVFPVGLPDALWFTFQNENLTVNISKSLDMALDSAEGSASARVFEFDKNGNVEEVIRTKETIIAPKTSN